MSNRQRANKEPVPRVWAPEAKEAAFSRLCAEIALGKSLRKICNAKDMPSVVTAREWINNDDALAKRYARAREEQADFYADEIAEIADTEKDPHKARVRIDARKWIAAKLKSRTYGDKVTHSGDPENPIQHEHVHQEADAFTRRIAGSASRIGTGSGTGETEH